MNKLFLAFVFFCCLNSFGHTSLSLDTAIASALTPHPLIQLSLQKILQQQALKKGNFSLQSKEVTIETPFGKKFVPWIVQNMDNPFVYVQQSKRGKQNVLLAESGLEVNNCKPLRTKKKSSESLKLNESTGLKHADAIISAASLAYTSGEISYIVYMHSLNKDFAIRSGYYETLRNYNQAIILVNYFFAK